MHRSACYRIATIFWIGKFPVAPGTAATLVAGVPCFFAIGRFSWYLQLAFALAVYWIGWFVSEKTEQELGINDPREVVIDELCGYLIAMTGHALSFPSVLIGLLFFRLFDIWKPWPIRLIERKLRGGAAIMMDDVAAGIFANALGVIVLKTCEFRYK